MKAQRLSVILYTLCRVSFLLVSSCTTLSSQSSLQLSDSGIAKGVPYIRNYTPSEYAAHNQNWAIVQDARGVMYFGNGEGVLEYDGVTWNIIKTARNTAVRSLAVDQYDHIYVGAYNDIGYLAPDNTQQLRFISLVSQLDEQYRSFSDVWQTIATAEGIYFVTQKYIFRWDGIAMRVWTATTSFHVGFGVNGQFFVRQIDVGLMKVKSDSLVMVPSGEKLAAVNLMTMLPFPAGGNDQYLIGTHEDGLFRFDGQTVEKFSTDADLLLSNGLIYRGTRLSNGHYAFGTMQDGVIVVDQQGKLQMHLTKVNGLQDETILYLYSDRQGGLWIGMHIGISRAETGSPHTYFGEHEGLEGSVNGILRHQGKLYAATTMGVYVLDESSGSPVTSGKFLRIHEISPQAWALQSFGPALLVGTFEGVYEIRESRVKPINDTYCMSMLRSRIDTNRVFVGLQKGAKSLYYSNGTWLDEGRFEETDSKIIHIHETPEGMLWLTARHEGVVLADFSNGYTRTPHITQFDTTSGLTTLSRTTAFMSMRGLRFASADGIFLYDEDQQRFHRDTSMVKDMPEHAMFVFSVSEDQYRNLWMVTPGASGIGIPQPDSSFVWSSSPFFRIAAIDDYCAYPDERDDVIWIGCVDRVIRYDRKIEDPATHAFKTLIRQIAINGDSLLYGGATVSPLHSFTLQHGFKSLRIRFSAPCFDEEATTLYQYMLEGSDTQWSDWSTETYKDYTSIPHGHYRFLVHSKNIYEQLGEIAAVEIEVLPPFYLAWWAFLVYTLIFGAILLMVRQREINRMRKKHVAELKQLEFEKLKELDQLKSHFFANISHEFRTPLTMILGPTENLLAAKPDQEQAKQYQLIRQNAQRLLSLINQLLDLSKLETGKMKLDMQADDIIPLLRNLINSFESLIVTKHLQLRLRSDTSSAILIFDRDKMEQIITNLLSNAIKFTPQNGEVSVVVTTKDDQKELQIDVTNTGPGISGDQLPYIFDRFYQGAEAQRTGEPGTGIGLALAKELVELHNGRITARSDVDKSTTFSMTFPLAEETTSFQEITIEKGISGIHEENVTAESSDPMVKEYELTAENSLLLVEDNPDMRSFIRDILSRTYRIIEAADGQEGLEKAVEHIPDLIVSDVMMPRLDGLDLCHLLKQDERTSHIPVILLTAKADIESRLAGLERGADDYLAKPFNRNELTIRARNLLDLRKRLWQRYTSMQPPAPVEEKDIQIEDAFLQKVRGILEVHLSDSEFEIDSLAQIIGMSRSQLFRKIKALTGQSPSIYIRSIRLQRGKELLESTAMNVSEVAYTVGFSTPTYFSDAFSETFGIRPSQLRK